MLRLLSATFVATAVALPFHSDRQEPVADPPSSLEPGAARGRVRLTHMHGRTVACSPQKKTTDVACRAKREDADSATKAVLRPVPAPRITVKDTRQPISINFAHRVGRQERELELATGKWELEWQGYNKLEYFQVARGEEFELGLITISGSCEKKQQQCLLIPDSSTRRVVIPEKQR